MLFLLFVLYLTHFCVLWSVFVLWFKSQFNRSCARKLTFTIWSPLRRSGFWAIWGNYARKFVSCFWTTRMIPHLSHFTCHRSCLHTKRCRLILLSRRVPLESSRSRHKFLRGTCPYLATMVATKKLQCWFHGWTSRQVVTHYPGTLLPPFYFHPQKSVKKIFPWYSGLSRGLILEILKTRTFFG